MFEYIGICAASTLFLALVFLLLFSYLKTLFFPKIKVRFCFAAVYIVLIIIAFFNGGEIPANDPPSFLDYFLGFCTLATIILTFMALPKWYKNRKKKDID